MASPMSQILAKVTRIYVGKDKGYFCEEERTQAEEKVTGIVQALLVHGLVSSFPFWGAGIQLPVL